MIATRKPFSLLDTFWRKPRPKEHSFSIFKSKIAAAVLILFFQFPLSHSALGQFTQQGSKIAGAQANTELGRSVALSADGNTAVIGELLGVRVFSRSNGVWDQGTSITGNSPMSVAISTDGNTVIVGTNGSGILIFARNGSSWDFQSGGFLTGTGGVGTSGQGRAVALSANGDTAIMTDPFDNSGTGAAWVFTRSNGVWTQQGSKIFGDASSGDVLGVSVALSADGNTAIVGSEGANAGIGAVSVFTRSGGVWSQQGSKFAGDAPSPAFLGHSIALSADGNTAIVGGYVANGSVGGTWVFVRNAGSWSQQGQALVGSGASGSASQGSSVALSSDGNTALVGGNFDDSSTGATWVFTRSGGTWTQQGSKLVGTGEAPAAGGQQAEQGNAVALSGDGNTFVTAGYLDDYNTMTAFGHGAIWFFVQNPIVNSVSSNTGLIAGGASVTVGGSHLSGATAVTFGGAAATNIAVVDDGTITATTPAHALGSVDVVVTTDHGTGTGTGAFTYFVALSINSVTPNAGPLGGTGVDILGSGFSGATSVKFGAVNATTFSVVSDGHLTATAPAHAAGAVDVAVASTGGTATLAGGFSYFGAPAIAGINPNTGPAGGGILVSIVGANLNGLTGVSFGTTASSSFSASSNTSATATAPSHAVGAVHVSVTTPGGTTALSPHDLFTYTPTPVLTALAKFAGGAHDGGKPFGALIADKSGALYGTTSVGGAHNKGTVFRMTPPAKGKTAWSKTILHNFAGTDGAGPYAGLAMDRSGNLYGTTLAGGANGKGVVFKLMAPNFAFTVLHSFKGDKTDGATPYAGIAIDTHNNLFGAAVFGGNSGDGTVFKIAGAAFSVVHQFSGGTDGRNPVGTLVLDKSGNIYGTSELGDHNGGVLFKLGSNGKFFPLHTFGMGADGAASQGSVHIDGKNSIYGTTAGGGSLSRGIVFKVTPPGRSDTALYNFNGLGGSGPAAGLVADTRNVFYGTTVSGGAVNRGAVFKLLPPANGQSAWTESVMYSFRGGANDGANPYGSVLLGKNGVLYGTASAGGGGACTGGCGMVFMLTY